MKYQCPLIIELGEMRHGMGVDCLANGASAAGICSANGATANPTCTSHGQTAMTTCNSAGNSAGM